MKASELRIGNYYMFADYNGIVYRQVKEIKHNQFGLLSDYDEVNFEICRPIPITEEWLLKFGFEKEMSYYISKESNIEFYLSNGNLYCELHGETVFNIIYVHQLQNLHFALIGEELCK